MIIISKFAELGNSINTVLLKLITSQNLCKYLYYNDSTPLDGATIADTSSLLYTKIYPYNHVPDTQEESGSILNLIFDWIGLSDNPYYKKGNLNFIILCHRDVWRTNINLRPFCIMAEIDTIFNSQSVIGIGKGEFGGCVPIWSENNYSGYKLIYKNWEFN